MLAEARDFVTEWQEQRTIFHSHLFGMCLRPPLQVTAGSTCRRCPAASKGLCSPRSEEYTSTICQLQSTRPVCQALQQHASGVRCTCTFMRRVAECLLMAHI